MRKLTAYLFAIVFLAHAPAGPANAGEPAPIVVELFTSQGCPACPEAEAYLRELANRDDVIALEFHIDYYDYAGWKDPFGDPAHTRRWQDYAHALGARYEYTPFMVVGGDAHLVGSDRAKVEAQIGKARRGDAEHPGLTVETDGRQATISVDGAGPAGIYDILLVAFDRERETTVTAGGNRGRTLIEANVVRDMRRIGQWAGEPIRLQIDLSTLPGDGGSAILLQQAGGGPILAAAAVAF